MFRLFLGIFSGTIKNVIFKLPKNFTQNREVSQLSLFIGALKDFIREENFLPISFHFSPQKWLQNLGGMKLLVFPGSSMSSTFSAFEANQFSSS